MKTIGFILCVIAGFIAVKYGGIIGVLAVIIGQIGAIIQSK